ncbi:TolC family protein [Eleftheria terrae]|uniref:TolC family protein n=1 Tax=Eleftheria terrae TaxID=1597781 RepID=UPI00263AAA27|nr:TolC family protein [Eleftheria terrae]WKB52759.1 TolC family protein [Eleftheria terrae]
MSLQSFFARHAGAGRPWLLCAALAGLWPAAASSAPCTGIRDSALPALSAAPDTRPALGQLQALARLAEQQSQALAAAGLSAQAARADLDETRATGGPQLNLGAAALQVGAHSSGLPSQGQSQASLSLSLSAPLYDGGRQRYLAAWRERLADAAALGSGALREQVLMEAVGSALERNRLLLQAQIYAQYVGKMSCLSGALQEIVTVDRGRASELVQARKTQAQAAISVEAVATQVRQAEERLRKLLGERLPAGEDIAQAFYGLPALDEVTRQAEASQELRQLGLQADAARQYAQAVAAARRPQLSWTVSRSQTAGSDRDNAAWQAGVALNYTLFDGGAGGAAESAALKRAEAARLQQAELRATRLARVRELYEAASAAFARARQYAEVLQDSDRVRDFTIEQWSQLGRRSLFDVMSAESEYYGLRVAYVNALHDAFLASAQLRSAGQGLAGWLLPAAR